MKPSFVAVAGIVPFLGPAAAADYLEYATTAFRALQDSWYNTTSGLWTPSAGWWNSANCMTAIADLAKIDKNSLPEASDIFSNAYKKAPEFNPKNNVRKFATPTSILTIYGDPPGIQRRRDLKLRALGGNADGFVNSCYDDNGWWALAWIGAWDLTGNSEYLETAKGIFDQMSGGGPTNCSNGGIIWCSDQDYYVNAIANELYLAVAAQLANRDSDSKYLQTAEKQWEWFKNSGMINSDSLINDGLERETCKNNGGTVWTYNQGVVLGALVELNKAKGGGDYLNSANTIAQAAIAHFADGNKVIHESCEPNCGPDGSQFKGILARNLQALQEASPTDLYKSVILANVDSIWAKDRNDLNQLSLDWGGPYVDPVNASTHSSAMDALNAAAAIS